MIAIRDVRKSFKGQVVVDGIGLDVDRGGIVSILGPSGSGKSTFLRCLNRLETPDAGTIDMSGDRYDLAKLDSRRLQSLRMRIGMVFQNYNLFRHRTAIENILEGLLVVKRLPRREAQEIAEHHLALMGLADKAAQYPSSLSGGQQQRVAIARTLAMAPELILFDEPTSALDPEHTGEVLEAIRKAAGQGIPMIIVTHEMGFAREISSQVLFIDGGRVIEQGDPKSLFGNPQQQRTRDFLKNYLRSFSFDI
ncbi:amino acid ABC transporter ATP-binding protein [Inquilinus limosus]|uniref:Amino acid ABC transporter ATP-binding protein n=1 Tax=Inquilinus limosus MP06 TaxID=1398085 RepID=A0A0A0D6I0_9PROT|nr:amino acid ABC transporter ATP-binding protein [Inquilinus limosus]KGM33704.1 amino acid ABC transporter ATP-binding protein [Inquilinus limosus MP06]